MPKRTIIIDDKLPDMVEGIKAALEEMLTEYLEERKPARLPDLSNDLDYAGVVHEMIESWIPVYTYELHDIYYLHGAEIQDVVDIWDRDCGPDSHEIQLDTWRMRGVYYYLEHCLNEWYDSFAEAVFDKYEEAAAAALDAEEARI